MNLFYLVLYLFIYFVKGELLDSMIMIISFKKLNARRKVWKYVIGLGPRLYEFGTLYQNKIMFSSKAWVSKNRLRLKILFVYKILDIKRQIQHQVNLFAITISREITDSLSSTNLRYVHRMLQILAYKEDSGFSFPQVWWNKGF